MNPSKGRLILAERGLARIALVLFAAAITLVFVSTKDSWAEGEDRGKTTASERQTDANAQRMLDEGKQTFRFDTFGDEQLWTDVLQMQHAIKSVSPAAALSVGLKVDADATRD